VATLASCFINTPRLSLEDTGGIQVNRRAGSALTQRTHGGDL